MVKTWDECGRRSSAPHNHNGILENEDVNPYESIDDQAPIWETNPCLDRDTYITLYNYIYNDIMLYTCNVYINYINNNYI